MNTTVDCSDKGFIQVPANIPADTTSLDLSSNNIQQLDDYSFSTLPLLTSLDLSSNSLVTIQPAAFYNLSKLRELSLSRNNLSALPSAIFRPLKSLAALSLADNNLPDILSFDEIWDGLHLTKLDLRENKITEAKFSQAFSEMPSLTSLDLSLNRISVLKIADFEPFVSHRFQTLELSVNPITVIEPGFFAQFRTIEYLVTRLDINIADYSNTINEGAFQFLQNSSLKSLVLGWGSIKELQDWAFHGLDSLEYLTLQTIHIEKTSPHAFGGLQNLVVLNLGENHLEQVPFKAPTVMFPALRELHLKYNNIKTIVPENFRGLPNLQLLNLDRNMITNIPANVFHGLRNLNTLSLQNNKISLLSNESFVGLENVIFMDLSMNKLTVLPDGVLSPLTSLEKLDFSENYISPDMEDFNGLKKITTLNLHQNHVILRLSTFRLVSSLEDLNLSGNDLFNEHMQCWFKNSPCKPFTTLRNLLTLDISDNLIAPASNMQEFFEGLVSLRTLRVIRTGDVWRRFQNTTVLYSMPNLETLNMRECKIQHIPADALSIHYNLQFVDFSENSISSLPDTVFVNVRSLKYLYLKTNTITFLNESSFATVLPTLESFGLDLSENPFYCDCSITWFVSWADANPSKVIFWEKDGFYVCNTPASLHNRELRSFHPDCDSHLNFYMCAATTSLLSLYMLTVFVVTQCSWYVRYLWFLLQARFRGYEELPGREVQRFKYDAFVAYSSADKNWVTQVLRPQLEDNPPRYRLCFGERDFRPGVAITENIGRAVRASRRTICLITRSFVRSSWCNYEMRASEGRYHLFDPRRVNLILVFLEEIPDGDMERHKHLQDVLRRDTYISWPGNDRGRPLFWARLREALGKPLPVNHARNRHILEDSV
ncbi:PREDICTED: toll-like receptor 3 [Branchiostoma belcheri]|uniref:Toll-like receptor 3 n=1 Tax=Branchiostoma belcheri TaxID=7741 RepID=A0A6P4Z613_BRABE|nr:PREDICTED: toll-like receptor 3 [Branchiostoma belcheri]